MIILFSFAPKTHFKNTEPKFDSVFGAHYFKTGHRRTEPKFDTRKQIKKTKVNKTVESSSLKLKIETDYTFLFLFLRVLINYLIVAKKWGPSNLGA